MTPKQKIEVRLSEVRTRLNEIAGIEGDEFNDEVRTELDALKTEFGDLESRHQAAIISEGDDEARAAGMFGPQDGEAGERGRLLRETTLADYLDPAAAGGAIQGRAAELNAALELPAVSPKGGVALPWAMLECPEHRGPMRPAGIETRAFTTTANNDGPEMQRPILQRLFGAGIMDTLGVRMDTVPVGRSEWPLVSGGVAPAQALEGGAAAAAVAMTFNYANLKPKRLTGRYEYTHEMAASVPELEQAIRRDIADAVKARMSALIISGAAVDASDAATAANAPGNGGFTVALAAVNDTQVADAARYGRLHAQAVDGIHASMETEVMSVIGDETYTHAAGTYLAGSAVSGTELLRTRSAGCMASTYIPDAASDIQLAILHASGPNGGAMRGDSVAAMWPTLEIIRDIYSQASQGVTLTWVTLWDAQVAFRAGAYELIGIQIA